MICLTIVAVIKAIAIPMQKKRTCNPNKKSGTFTFKDSSDWADTEIAKYAIFDSKVQLLKVTNLDRPTGYIVISSHSLIVITRIFPAPIFHVDYRRNTD